MLRRIINKNGFSIVEIITVLAIIGVFIAFFYTLLFLNWEACNRFLAQADFGQDMDTAIDAIANDARLSKDFNISNTASSVQVVFNDVNENPISTYVMYSNGEMTETRPGLSSVILTENLNYANSNFVSSAINPGNLVVNISMIDQNQLFGHPIILNSQTELYPRNSGN